MSVHDGPHRYFMLYVISELKYLQGAVLLETLIMAKLIKKFQHLMEPEGFLSCSQDFTSSPYPVVDESSPHLPNLFI